LRAEVRRNYTARLEQADGRCGEGRCGPAPAGAEPPERYHGSLRDAGFAAASIDVPAPGVAPGAICSAVARATRPAIRPATRHDLPLILELLAGADLPTTGLDSADVRLFVAVGSPDDGRPTGVAGYEPHGEAVLLRSLAVRPDVRGRGLGVALIHHVERQARGAGADAAYALTTTIPALLARLGYRPLTREGLPADLHASPELQGSCPSSAAVYELKLR